MKTLASLSSHLAVKPPSGRRVAIARELTKIYEQVVLARPLNSRSILKRIKIKYGENLWLLFLQGEVFDI